MPENVDQKIALAQEIIKGGISVILSLGLLGILGFNA
jgi:hypothetical protein